MEPGDRFKSSSTTPELSYARASLIAVPRDSASKSLGAQEGDYHDYTQPRSYYDTLNRYLLYDDPFKGHVVQKGMIVKAVKKQTDNIFTARAG